MGQVRIYRLHLLVSAFVERFLLHWSRATVSVLQWSDWWFALDTVGICSCTHHALHVQFLHKMHFRCKVKDTLQRFSKCKTFVKYFHGHSALSRSVIGAAQCNLS